MGNGCSTRFGVPCRWPGEPISAAFTALRAGSRGDTRPLQRDVYPVRRPACRARPRRARAPQPSEHSLNAGPCCLSAVACESAGQVGPRASRPSRAVLTARMVGTSRAGYRGCPLHSLWSLRPRMPGILGGRALWPSGTRACRKRAAVGTLAGHAPGNPHGVSASRAPVERESFNSGPRPRRGALWT